ncbi:hypothetical protein AAG906_019957 [Vitis piasezkii]
MAESAGLPKLLNPGEYREKEELHASTEKFVTSIEMEESAEPVSTKIVELGQDPQKVELREYRKMSTSIENGRIAVRPENCLIRTARERCNPRRKQKVKTSIENGRIAEYRKLLSSRIGKSWNCGVPLNRPHEYRNIVELQGTGKF